MYMIAIEVSLQLLNVPTLATLANEEVRTAATSCIKKQFWTLQVMTGLRKSSLLESSLHNSLRQAQSGQRHFCNTGCCRTHGRPGPALILKYHRKNMKNIVVFVCARTAKRLDEPRPQIRDRLSCSDLPMDEFGPGKNWLANINWTYLLFVCRTPRNGRCAHCSLELLGSISASGSPKLGLFHLKFQCPRFCRSLSGFLKWSSMPVSKCLSGQTFNVTYWVVWSHSWSHWGGIGPAVPSSHSSKNPRRVGRPGSYRSWCVWVWASSIHTWIDGRIPMSGQYWWSYMYRKKNKNM